MLVIFGANGRTGVEVLRAALLLGHTVRPVVRDDRDARNLDKLVDVQDICYADPEHPDAIAAVLEGASQIVSCIDARTAGPEAPRYSEHAGANIVRSAAEQGIDQVLHLSVVGAYRWSPSRLNRASFRSDRQIRLLKEHAWSMVRVSCYLDELIEGHVQPPDGLRPHPIRDSSRYAPISRRDLARMVVDLLGTLVPHRTYYVGGPEVFRGADLRQLVTPSIPAARGRRRTQSSPLPPGDVAVTPESSRVNFRVRPRDQLADLLSSGGSGSRSRSTEPQPVYPQGSPSAHPADRGDTPSALLPLGPVLRRIVHQQLVEDLGRMGLQTRGSSLDFSAAAPLEPQRSAQVHGGTLTRLSGVRALDASGSALHEGEIEFLYDQLAEVFFCWWTRDSGIPEAIWSSLDLGVRRRLSTDPHFASDDRITGFAGGHEQVDPPA